MRTKLDSNDLNTARRVFDLVASQFQSKTDSELDLNSLQFDWTISSYFIRFSFPTIQVLYLVFLKFNFVHGNENVSPQFDLSKLDRFLRYWINRSMDIDFLISLFFPFSIFICSSFFLFFCLNFTGNSTDWSRCSDFSFQLKTTWKNSMFNWRHPSTESMSITPFSLIKWSETELCLLRSIISCSSLFFFNFNSNRFEMGSIRPRARKK